METPITFSHLFMFLAVLFTLGSAIWQWASWMVPEPRSSMNIECSDNRAIFFFPDDTSMWCKEKSGSGSFFAQPI